MSEKCAEFDVKIAHDLQFLFDVSDQFAEHCILLLIGDLQSERAELPDTDSTASG
ncbi:hypothetical protein [Rhodopseudomonas pseudopalustris]|uniref:Uncharacterized protein n=1 Tax=Rhodopseudomonas pseudopalustris TaxID=1513892 RepID=A0A1H8Q481_9BRAD|nr:hypothetical protein [Rhodopseudomonas pseudopalustris]SEO48828.1 hypothetical protein SAMN05444123_10343 [Rhodopseudomonas pseudopalustris]